MSLFLVISQRDHSVVRSLVLYVPHGDFNPLWESTLGVHFGGPLWGSTLWHEVQIVSLAFDDMYMAWAAVDER